MQIIFCTKSLANVFIYWQRPGSDWILRILTGNRQQSSRQVPTETETGESSSTLTRARNSSQLKLKLVVGEVSYYLKPDHKR